MLYLEKAKIRFLAKVDRNGPVPAHRPELGPCHVWIGTLTGGYGYFWINGRTQRAHRVAFFFAHGRMPEPCALHHCDNRSCVNDGHLFEGTNADNVADRESKGRNVVHSGDEYWKRRDRCACIRGSQIGTSVLTEQDVLEIRSSYAMGRVTQKQLAAQFGVTQSCISKIVLGRSWGA